MSAAEPHPLECQAPPVADVDIAELDSVCRQVIEELQARIDAYDERAAFRAEATDDGLTTTERAIAALQRPERFNGEYAVARAWLRDCAPNTRIFSREAKK